MRLVRRTGWVAALLVVGLALGASTSREPPRPAPPPQVNLAGVRHDAGPVGVGAAAPTNAVPLISEAGHAAFTRAGRPPADQNLSAEDVAGLHGEAAVPVELGDLVTRTVMGDHRLHVEWLAPPGGAGQMAGNSGVYLQGRYEIQVLGTLPGDAAPAKNEAGAIYNVKAADVNASTGPGTWQSYDVWFRAPRFEGGRKVEDARVTVLWNGRLVHDDVAIAGPTGSAQVGGEEPRPAGDVQVGPLVLQAHATDAEGPVRYRNVWVAPLAPPPALGEARAIFDGQSLDGWRPLGGEARYEVRDGAIVGATVPNTPNTFLATVEEYGDFELEVELLADDEVNSGIQFRSATQDGSRDRGARVTGYQAEIEHDGTRNWAGGLYDEAGRGWLFPLTASPEARAAFKPGEWNRFRICARGPVIRTWVNDVPATVAFDDFRPRGFIALQVHGVGDRRDPLTIRWRHLRLRTPGSTDRP